MSKFSPYIFVLYCVILLTPQFASTGESGPGTDYSKQVFSYLKNQIGNSVYDYRYLLKGSNGHLWIGTDNGILKYDGYHFYRFLTYGEESYSIQTKDDTIWFGNLSELQQYETKQERITKFKHNKQKKNTMPSGVVNTIYKDKQQQLWLGTLEHLVLFNQKEQTFNSYSPWKKEANQDTSAMSAKYVGISDIYQHSEHIYWLSTFHNGLIRFNHQQDSARIVRTFNDAQNKNNILVKGVRAIEPLDSDNLLLATSDGLIRFDINNETFHRYPKNKPITESLYALIKTAQGDIWTGGKKVYHIDNNQHIAEYQQVRDFGILENNIRVGALYFDEELGIYILFNGKGIYHSNPYATAIKSIKSAENSSNQVLALLKTGASTFTVSYAEGVFFASVIDGIVEYREVLQHNNESFKAVTAMHKGLDNTLWVADPTQVSAIDINGKVRHYPYAKDSDVLGKEVKSIVQDYRGDIWLSFYRSPLLRLNTSREYFEEIEPLKEQQLQSWSDIWLRVTPNRKSLVFIKMTNGYGIYDIENERIERVYKTTPLKFDYEKPYPLERANLWRVDDGHGKDSILMSLNKRYFTKVDYTGTKFNKVETPNIEGIVGILSDSFDENVYWLASTQGVLHRWNTLSNEHKVFGSLEGIPKSGISDNNGIMLADGTIIWGSQEGLVMLNTRDNKKNTYKPKAVLNQFDLNYVSQKYTKQQYGESTVLNKPITHLTNLKLNHQQNNIQFGFFSSSYAAPSQNRFLYRLIGLQDDWVETGAEYRKARFTNLKPGNYTFEVKASNNHGVFSDVRKVHIEIMPPWWRTWWAYLFYFCLVSYFIYWRNQKKKQQVELLEQTVSVRTKELVHSKDTVEQLMLDRQHLVENIYHQTRTPLQLMLGNISALETRNVEVDVFCARQRNDIFKLTHLTDQVLDVSKVTQSNKTTINIAPILKELAVSYRDIAKSHELTLSWKIDEELFTCCSVMSIEKAIDNVLSNAIKYTERGEIKFSALLVDGQVVICCVDTGIGIPDDDLASIGDRYSRASNVEDKQGTGIGLAMIKDVVSAHEGKLTIESKIAVGTQVTIRLKAEHRFNQIEAEQLGLASQLSPLSPLSPQSQPLQSGQVPQKQPADTAVNNNEQPIILIAEDNIELASYINSVLESKYQLINALSGEEALTKALETVPDLIVSDVMMGSLDGFELVENIRACDICCHIPIILLTAKSDDYSREHGYKVGASDFINKPFKESDLKHRINNQLQLVAASVQKSHQAPQADNPVDVLESASDDKLVMRFLKFVTEHYSNSELQTKDMCEQLFVSNRQLERKVKHFLNVTPKHFLNDFRLARAKECIERGDTISEIYFSCGFSTHAYFTKKFKDKYSITPSECKKRQLK